MKKIKDTIKSIYDMNLEELGQDRIEEMIKILNRLEITVNQQIKILKLEDKNKKLTLTDEQYKTWLETDVALINPKQFEILYGINIRNQTKLRSHIKDPLPSFQLHGKGTHYYDRKKIENWLDNYKRLNPFK